MKVYRVCKEEEMNNILVNNSCSNCGLLFSKTIINNHNYDSNKKYLHFFGDINNILYLNLQENYYVCVYDIPEDILLSHKGIGHYLDLFNFEKEVDVNEYAIEAELVSFDYLLQSYRLLKSIDIDDCINHSIYDYLDIVYDKGSAKKYEKTLYQNE